jgi:hypothetical protein
MSAYLCAVLSFIGRGLAVGRSSIPRVLPKCLSGFIVSGVNFESNRTKGVVRGKYNNSKKPVNSEEVTLHNQPSVPHLVFTALTSARILVKKFFQAISRVVWFCFRRHRRFEDHLCLHPQGC